MFIHTNKQHITWQRKVTQDSKTISQEPGILAEQIRMAYGQLPTAIIVGLIVAFGIAWVFEGVLPTQILVSWYTILLAVSVFRLMSARKIVSGYFQPNDARLYASYYNITAFMLGSTWAAITFVMPFVSNEYRIFILVVLVSVSGGALTSNASMIRAYYSYAFPIFLLLAIHSFLIGDKTWNLIGTLIVIYAVFLALTSRKLYDSLLDSIVLRFKWEGMASELEDTKTKLEQAVEHLQHLSAIDALTGIENRRSFDAAIAREWSRARRGKHSIALLMIDVDHFKKYNDTYLHQMGDQALIAVAHVIQRYARRPGDLAARYGGEEFALILSHPDSKHINSLAEEMREEVLGLEIGHENSGVHQYLTISIGVAFINEPESDDYSPMISAADTALYQAKQEGRNRVCVAVG